MPRAHHAAPMHAIPVGRARQTGAICILQILFACISLSASDFYLMRLGPPPLRFAPVSNGEFKWPMPLPKPSLANTNMPGAGKFSTVITPTNVLATADSAVPKTNGAAPQPISEISVSSAANLMPTPVGADGNPLSASNLLVVTPQMLADYLKATLDSSLKSSTNAPAGADIPFSPPTPKLPASEAIYRTQ